MGPTANFAGHQPKVIKIGLTAMAKLLVVAMAWLTVASAAGEAGSLGSGSCAADVKDHYRLFATRTGYFAVVPKVDPASASASALSKVSAHLPDSEGCQVQQVWFLFRHGTRYPETEVLEQMNTTGKALHAKLLRLAEANKGSICEEDLEQLKKWDLLMKDEGEAWELTSSGKEELEFIGSVFGGVFPHLKQANRTNFVAKSTSRPRAKDSAANFFKGLSGGDEEVKIPVEEADNLLWYQNCPLWRTRVLLNNATFAERDRFTRSRTVSEGVVKAINDRLQPVPAAPDSSNSSLSFEDVSLMYKFCAYETAWNLADYSPWCAFFTDEQLQIMEYAEDLEAWASLSYGNASNTGFSYRLLEDMTSKFSDRNQEATLYFAHVEVLFPFMTLLRINEDPFSLTADTYDRKRAFRSSLMAPFAANMGFALYQCPSAVDRPVVVAFHNQVPLALPKCPGPCYLEDFKKNYLNPEFDFNSSCIA